MGCAEDVDWMGIYRRRNHGRVDAAAMPDRVGEPC